MLRKTIQLFYAIKEIKDKIRSFWRENRVTNPWELRFQSAGNHATGTKRGKSSHPPAGNAGKLYLTSCEPSWARESEKTDVRNWYKVLICNYPRRHWYINKNVPTRKTLIWKFIHFVAVLYKISICNYHILCSMRMGTPLRKIGSSSFRWNKRKATFASLAEGKVWGVIDGKLFE